MLSLVDRVISDFSHFMLVTLVIFFLSGLAWSLLTLDKVSLSIKEFIHIISKGAIVFTVFSIIISPFSISRIPVFIWVAVCSLIIFRFIDRLSMIPGEYFSEICFLILATGTFFVFWNYGSIRIWPPVGDIATAHAPLVNTFTSLGHLPLSNSELTILYPPGFHILASMLNQVHELYAPQVVFYTLIVITALIPLMNYLIAHRVTGSNILGITAFTLSWIVHPSLHCDRYMLGPLFNGTYPFLYGFFIIQLIVMQWCKPEDNRDSAELLGSTLLFMVALFFVYPMFALLTSISLTVIIFSRNVINPSHLKRFLYEKRNSFSLLGVGALAILFVKPEIRNIVYYFSTQFAFNGQASVSVVSTESYAYMVDYGEYISGLLGLISMVSVILGLFIEKVRKSPVFLMFVPCFAVTMVSALFEPLNRYLFLVTPSRSVLVTQLLGVMVLLSVFKELADRSRFISSPNLPHFSREQRRFLFFCILMFTSIVLTLPSTKIQFKRNFRKVPSTRYYDDFDAFIWVGDNTSPSDVIEASPTWISWYLESFTDGVYVHHQYNRLMDTERDRDLWQIWLTPGDEVMVESLLAKHNVKYLVVTSAEYQFDFAEEWSFRRKPALYNFYFKDYTFLVPELMQDNVAVYSVDQ